MSEFFVTTNPAEFTRLPGLYLSETAPPRFVEGVALNRVGMFGKTVRGPLTPQFIDSAARFEEVYGGRDIIQDGPLVNEVWKALANKPFGGVVVCRVAAAAAVSAALTIDAKITVTASSPGSWGNGITVAVENASSGVSTECNIRIVWRGETKVLENVNLDGAANNIPVLLGGDIGNLVTIAKIAIGRPANQVATALTAGADGTIAATDYTAALALMQDYAGIDVVLCPESLEETVAASNQATLNAAMVTAANASSDRVFLTWSGIYSNTPSSEVSAVASQVTTRNKRLVWCYNPAKTLDPVTAAEVETGPHVWLASILSQVDVDVHPGALETRKILAGIRSLRQESLSRANLILLRNAGISTLEKVSGGFQFRDAISTILDASLREITRLRSADFINLSSVQFLAPFVKAKSTEANRAVMTAGLDTFLAGLKADERIVKGYEIKIITTNAERAQGIEKVLLRVKLIGHMLYIVLEAEIGTTVVIVAEQ